MSSKMKSHISVVLLCLVGISTAVKFDWKQRGRDSLKEALKVAPNVNIAKNVILFIGDGMGLSTITPARIYKGQQANEIGETQSFAFETFPHVGLSKTFSNDRQVTESGAAANAMLAGTKLNSGTLGVNTDVLRTNCDLLAGNEIDNIIKWSMDADKWTGIVTTTRLTHATPAAAYAHCPERKWESDAKQPKDAALRSKCKDIAYQLVMDNPNINVLMGGARTNFLPNTTADPEYDTIFGKREDGINLIEKWIEEKKQRQVSHAYVWNQTTFDDVSAENTDYLLGLFEHNNLQYELNRADDKAGEPSLAEMAEKAVNLLKRKDEGFFLLVEGGRIDHAHHDTLARLALHDTASFDDAVKKVASITDEKDTLIIVTADHSHPFSMGSWASLNNPILDFVDPVGFANEPSTDGKPYLSLSYGNGPGKEARTDLTGQDTTAKDFRFPVNVHTDQDTHGGEDVSIYARGPMAHLINGVHENQYIAHVMAYASCVGDNKEHCNGERRVPGCDVTSGVAKHFANLVAVVLLVVVALV